MRYNRLWWAVGLLLTAFLGHLVAQRDVPPEALALLHRILNDPMLPRRVHGARCVRRPAKQETAEFAIASPSGASLAGDSCSVWQLGGRRFDFMLLLEDDTLEQKERPDFDRIAPLWDAFIARYWPRLERVSLVDKERKRYLPSGKFSIQYALKENQAQVFRVLLDVCLADGRILGVHTLDARPHLGGKPVPPPPSQDVMFAAVLRALSARPGAPACRNLRPYEMSRYLMREPTGGVAFQYAMDLRADGPDGKTLVVIAYYHEATGKADILAVYDEKTLVEPHTVAMVSEDSPQWSSDGRRLYATTTRDPQFQPVWRRGGVLSVMMCPMAGGQAGAPLCVRPIRPLGQDIIAYGPCAVSPSGRYLAGTLYPGRLFLLRLREGSLYLLERDRKWREHALRVLGPGHEGDLPQGFAFTVRGIVWLPDETGLIGSFLYRLYLAPWHPDATPQELELVPLVNDRGQDVLPCLDAGGKQLAWAHQAPWQRGAQPTQGGRPPQEEGWELVVGALDVSKPEVRDRRAAALPAQPTSVSWSAARGEWLVVAGGRLLWVKDTKGELTVSPPITPKWGNRELRPVEAAAAPRGAWVAVAAKLIRPLVVPDKDTRVDSCLFIWDTLGEQVRPLLQPTYAGLPRFRFPGTGQPWARIHGDLTKYGLAGMVDPAFVVADKPGP